LNPLPQDRPELPELPDLEPLPPPEQLLEPSVPLVPGETDEAIPETINVEGFNVIGSTIFSAERFADILQPYTGEVSFAQLLQARSAVTQLYVDNGYITTGALIPPQTLEDGIVTIRVIEGELEDIDVTGTERLNSSYVRSRLRIATEKPLNVDRLLEALQLLQLDPLIQNLSAELSAGSRPGQNLLEVAIVEADSFSVETILDNGRSPSVGSFRRRGRVHEGNLFGLGDSISLTYTNTDGSNEIEAGYAIPINPRNGTIELNYSWTSSEIIEEPFDRLDIEAKSRDYDLTFRQPVLRTPTRELALGLTASRRESDTSLLGVDFPLSLGANDDGETRISALRFFQEWTQRGAEEVFAARSQFSLGLNALDATVNSVEPDSRFLAWRGQVQWLRLLAEDTSLLLRSDVQLATTSLVPLEQFGLGGQESVRGYRQDTLLTDNGIFASAEVRVPIYRLSGDRGVLQISPFVDFGTTWNTDSDADRAAGDPNTLVSVGVGLQFELGDRLSARIDWGIPLVDVEDREDETLQEEGIYFSLRWMPF
jgi:hemolysin activation/secretion protein